MRGKDYLAALGCVWLLSAAALAEPARPGPTPALPTERALRTIEGWTVRVDCRLLAPPHETLGARSLLLLAAKLADIRSLVAADRLAKLQQVVIVLDLSHGGLHGMQYHPNADWLEKHGYASELVKCVHLPEAALLVSPRHNHVQPWCVLHELAHAYHDQALGFDEPRIRQAYEWYKASGHGDQVLHVNGKRMRHYALTDHKEFFAEMSEAYFGNNDFFPFNRGELQTSEPEAFALLTTIWGPFSVAASW